MSPSTLEPLLLRILRRRGGPFDPQADPLEPGMQTALAGVRYLVACLANPRDTQAAEIVDGILMSRRGGLVATSSGREAP